MRIVTLESSGRVYTSQVYLVLGARAGSRMSTLS